MTKVLYYKSKQRCIILYYKSKQRCYGQSIVLQKKVNKVLYYKSKQRCFVLPKYYQSILQK